MIVIAKGHRQIGLITGPKGFRSAAEREAGFQDALNAAGITLPPQFRSEGAYNFESGLVAAERLLDLSPRPTAIFASNDEMAAAALYVARMRGIAVPEHLSIIGFDDTPIAAHVWPPLTTVRWPIVEMGRSAAKKLISASGMATTPEAEPFEFLSTFIERGSVAPPAG
jgi:LacI family transcriptional regulator